jgi:thiopurine S-methyltransferase
VHPEFWHERWRNGQIGFHQPAVDRHLPVHWPSLALSERSRVLVPLCGKSLDLEWLRARGHTVLGVEVSRIAVEAFFAEQGIPAHRRALRDREIYEAPKLELIRGDFFALTPAEVGSVEGFWDRAAAIAFTAEQRPAYVEQLSRLIPRAARGLLIAVEYPQHEMPGPPFSLDAREVEALFAPHFEVREVAREDRLEHEARMRSRGVTRWQEVCYRLRRR